MQLNSNQHLRQIDESNLLFIDIETATVVPDVKGSDYESAWDYKCRYQNEIDKKTDKPFTNEEYFKYKASLYAPFSRVVSIVVGRLNKGKITTKAYSSENEKELLIKFNSDLNKVYNKNKNTILVHYSGDGFDTPMLDKRLIVNGIKDGCPLITEEKFKKPWETNSLDLSKIWRGNSFYPDSLISVAACLGIPSPKEEMDGSMVSEYFWNGKLDEIEKYCIKDVETLIKVYMKMVFYNENE